MVVLLCFLPVSNGGIRDTQDIVGVSLEPRVRQPAVDNIETKRPLTTVVGLRCSWCVCGVTRSVLPLPVTRHPPAIASSGGGACAGERAAGHLQQSRYLNG